MNFSNPIPRGPLVRSYVSSPLRSPRDADSPAKQWQKTHSAGEQIAALQENVRQLQRQFDRLRKRGSGEDAGTGMTYMGEWSASVSYTEQNVVTRGALGEFICIQAISGTAPETGAPYWHGWVHPFPGVWG
jgi:hypothetical protein